MRLRDAYMTAAVLLWSACEVDRPVLAPSTGASLAMAADQGVSLVASATEWAGEPEVYDYVVPFAIEVHNRSASELRIKFEDFSLQGDAGYRTTALNPFQNALSEAQLSAADIQPAAYHYTPQRSRAAPRSNNSNNSAPSTAPPRRGTGYGGTGYYGGYGWGGGGLGWGLGGFYGPGFGPYNYWSWYPAGPPGWWWGSYYTMAPPPRRGTSPAARFALAEGSVAPKGHVRGYVFFHRPPQLAGDLSLLWVVKNTEGKIVTKLDVDFQYVGNE